jgi:hypothetical protein
MRATPWVLVTFVLITSCSKKEAARSSGSGEAKPSEEAPGLGDVMVQVARRFEVGGRAASANRFELAAFEASEIGDLFENDVLRASLPKEGPTAQIPATAKAFLEAIPPELTKAAAAPSGSVR